LRILSVHPGDRPLAVRSVTGLRVHGAVSRSPQAMAIARPGRPAAAGQ
jgi:hypothetical protein